EKPLFIQSDKAEFKQQTTADAPPVRKDRGLGMDMQRYRVEVGRDHGASAGNIVGAIANESGLSADNIGRIRLFASFSTVELPAARVGEMEDALRDTFVAGQRLALSVYTGNDFPERPSGERPKKPRHDKAKAGAKAAKGKKTSGKTGDGRAPLKAKRKTRQ